MFAGNLILTAFRILNPTFGSMLKSNIFLLLIIAEILYIFPALPLYVLITKQKLKDIVPLKPLGWKNSGYILLMSVLIDPAALMLSALTSLFYPNAALEITSAVTFNNFPFALIGIALAPAIAEEICFRGVVLSASRGMSVRHAAALNGILFGLIHVSPQQIPYAIFLGVILSLYVIYTHSIFSSMMAHFMVNAATLALSLSPLRVMPISLGMLFVVASVFFACFLVVFKRFRLYNSNLI